MNLRSVKYRVVKLFLDILIKNKILKLFIKKCKKIFK